MEKWPDRINTTFGTSEECLLLWDRWACLASDHYYSMWQRDPRSIIDGVLGGASPLPPLSRYMQHRRLSIYAQAVQLILHSIQVVCVIDLGFLTNYVKALGIR